MAYTIDVYKKKASAEKHLGRYSLFVMFFPQLVAGPIERANGLLHQLKHKVTSLKYEDFLSGLSLMTWGFLKKIVVADQLAIFTDAVFDNYQTNNGFTVLLTVWFFALRIYCDFSGYSDIAIGAARMLGYRLANNFNLPYFSKSVTEFWRRWHISLSSWLKDYLYIPLGGNRHGKFITLRNIIVTMGLGGLWHGASWNFIVWGLLNGIYLSAEKIFNIKISFHGNKLYKIFRVIIVFNLICLTWIFFRAQTFEQGIQIIKSIPTDFFTLSIKDSGVFSNCVFGIIVLLFSEYFIFRKITIQKMAENNRYGALFLLNVVYILLIILFSVGTGAQFIYFQF